MKLALCNEVLGDMPFDEQCSFSKSLGYDGLELAPYTVDGSPHSITNHCLFAHPICYPTLNQSEQKKNHQTYYRQAFAPKGYNRLHLKY